jgi:hypothetical protein
MGAIRCLNDAHGATFAAYHGDCVDVLRQWPPNTLDFSVYSPPFSGLYIYNDSRADMGNSTDDGEFLRHYAFSAPNSTAPCALVGSWRCIARTWFSTARSVAPPACGISPGC